MIWYIEKERERERGARVRKGESPEKQNAVIATFGEVGEKVA